ncbi:class I SAM-dependent methyltransferase [Candidatus Methylacidithermus pantelleriae]|nr:SAM-dependent methyltransferase [Candidatus Methylacidithermus pantelleriae]
MELALYHPRLGYYAKADPTRIGRKGDYLTSPTVGSLFGRLLALQWVEVWELLGKPQAFVLIEQGAHTGLLASDILRTIREVEPKLWEVVRYWIIEPIPDWQTIQQQQLETHGVAEKVCWSSAEPPDVLCPLGVFFCNELVDSFPVHRIRYEDDRWKEWYVGYEGGQFYWTTGPLSCSELAKELSHLPLPAIPGYSTEICLRAREWLRNISRALSQGLFVIIDYGYDTVTYYSPLRSEGTLLAYERHKRYRNLLEKPGQRDLSSHVDFGSLARWGKEVGHETMGWTDQHHFLIGIASKYLGVQDRLLGLPRSAAAFQLLTHPEGFGKTFHVLVQSKGIASPLPLSGLRFARKSLGQ